MAVKCATFWDEGRVWPELVEDDIRVENRHSQARLIGLTDAGKTFLLDEVQEEGRRLLGDTLSVEPRMVQDIPTRAEDNGLSVEIG